MQFTVRLLLAAIGLMVCGSGVVDAQRVTGVVRDSTTSGPLSRASVELFSLEGKIAARDITDDAGLFSLQAPSAGSFRLRFQRVGYRPMSSGFFTMSGRDTSFAFRLTALAMPMDQGTLTASTRVYLENSGFTQRRRSDSGFFLDALQTTRLAAKATQTADLLKGIPGVTLRVAEGGLRVPTLVRQAGCEAGPRTYVNGNLMNPHNTVFDVNGINTADIAAIEVYRHAAQVPVRFGGSDATCGVIVVWTRH